MKSIDVIRTEHRALLAVLQALEFVLNGISEKKFKADTKLLMAMIQYITELPDKVHHPKEDDHLFVKVRARIPEAAGLIDKLEHDHKEGDRHILRLKEALLAFEQEGQAKYLAFETSARSYLTALLAHIDLEERELLPLAARGLRQEDWQSIDDAFALNEDPWAGATGKYKALFSQIVNLVPAPYGLN